MVDTTNKSDKQLYVAATGNAVLFTNTGLPSPLDLSSSADNHPNDHRGSPIRITDKFTYSAEINGAGEQVGEESGVQTRCNGDKNDLFSARSEACSDRIKKDWERTDKYLKDPDIMANLRSMATAGGLDSFPLRNISWRLFLGVLPTATDEWIETVDKQREKYYTEKNKADIDPHKTPTSHPLSNESSSAWNQFFLDQDLWLIIDQDVTRTWPEERIFTDQKIRNIMRRVLFTHAKVKSRVDYRQGMHELLANIIYMMCVEMENCPLAETTPEYIRHVVDPHFLEEDSYTLFCELMENCDIWYDGGHEEAIFKARTSIRVETPFEKEGIVLGMSPLSKKLNKIQGTLLKKHDTALSEYMDALDLSPQVYGIRWVRLLFGREFVLRDILQLWDALFAQGTSLDLIDYIAIAILIAMKSSILDHDQGDCLLRLMRYPQRFSVRTIINHALHLKNPTWPNPYPPNYTSTSVNYEKIVTISSPSRDNTDFPNTVPAEDTSKWSEMKSGTQGWKTKSLRSNINTITSHPMSLRNKIQTLPNRARFHTQISNPHSPTKKHDSVSSTNSNPLNTSNKSTETKNQVISLEKEVELLHVKSDYCVGKLTAYVDHLQDIMFNCAFATKENEDFAYLAIAGIKQVRDVLKGQLELGDSSFGLDSTMYHYLRESNPDLVEDHISKDSEPDKEPPRRRLADKELEEDSIDLFTNVSPPESSAEMVELRHTPDPLLDPSPSFHLSPSHPLDSID